MFAATFSEESGTSTINIPEGQVQTGDLVLCVGKTMSSYISGLPSSMTFLPEELGIASGNPEQYFLYQEGNTQQEIVVTGGPLISTRFVVAARFHQPGDGNVYRAYDLGTWSGVQTTFALVVLHPFEHVEELYAVWDTDGGWNADEFLGREGNPGVSPAVVAYPDREPYDHDPTEYWGAQGMGVVVNPDLDPDVGTDFTANEYAPTGPDNPLGGTGSTILPEVLTQYSPVRGALFQIALGAGTGSSVVPRAMWTHYDTACFGFSVMFSRHIPLIHPADPDRQGINVGDLICVEPKVGARAMTYPDDINPFSPENPSGAVALDKDTCTLYTQGDFELGACE